jgi:hypothetical protein
MVSDAIHANTPLPSFLGMVIFERAFLEKIPRSGDAGAKEGNREVL